MKIFITGVAGFLGSHLAEYYINNNHQVVGCDNMIGGYKDNVPDNCEFYEVDCNEYNKMKEIMKNCEIVYHCAASPYEGLSVYSPYVINRNTYMSTIGTLIGAVHNKSTVRRYVFCSSMARYGKGTLIDNFGTKEIGGSFKEYYQPCPIDPYGISKVAAEEQVKFFCNHSNIIWNIAVPHNIIGTRQKYDDIYRNVVSIMINLMLQGKQPFIYGDGEQTRCFSDVRDCLSCLIGMGERNEIVNQVINIGPDESPISINKLAEIISNILNFDLNPIYYPDRPHEVKHAVCSSNKARICLDYKTKYDIKETIEWMIEYIKEKGAKPFEYHMEVEYIDDKTPKTWTNKIH